MEKDAPIITFCIDCQEMCLSFEIADREFFFCNNPKCFRYGLMTAITTPIGNPPKELNEESEHKKI